MSTTEQASDDELMPRIAGGDREAFAELYRRRRLDVYRFALHMTASAAPTPAALPRSSKFS